MERQHVRNCFCYVFAVPNLEALLEVGTLLFAPAAAVIPFASCNHKFALMTFAGSFSLGALLCARAVAPIMIRQRSGIMALTGSIFADYTAPFNGAYASSKAAATSLFDALRLELAPYNISVCHGTWVLHQQVAQQLL
jgi:NAD(P)-dependent dehydrogenase (short-subunit alcohol dehydrogenase family)